MIRQNVRRISPFAFLVSISKQISVGMRKGPQLVGLTEQRIPKTPPLR